MLKEKKNSATQTDVTNPENKKFHPVPMVKINIILLKNYF